MSHSHASGYIARGVEPANELRRERTFQFARVSSFLQSCEQRGMASEDETARRPAKQRSSRSHHADSNSGRRRASDTKASSIGIAFVVSFARDEPHSGRPATRATEIATENGGRHSKRAERRSRRRQEASKVTGVGCKTRCKTRCGGHKLPSIVSWHARTIGQVRARQRARIQSGIG